MNGWPFILGAYLVTAIVIVAEVLAVRARHRAALAAAHDSPPPPPWSASATTDLNVDA